MENYKMQHLLDSVLKISKKYEDIAKSTGENYNIFSILSMESNERYTHSAIIGDLLNPKGMHSQGSIFLKLFFAEIDSLKTINDFNFDCANIIIEQHVGAIDADYTKGGFIDILIKDNKKAIVIENKIYASDQRNQLLRYKYSYPEGVLLYLNLFGDNPSSFSCGDLKAENDFYVINYQTHIVNWLEKCHNESINQPILRETIKQYLNLVKKLTNQTINNLMSEEIVNTMKKSIKESFEIENNIWKLQQRLYHNFMDLVKEFVISNEITVDETALDSNSGYFGLHLTPIAWSNKQYKICVLFVTNDYKDLYYGITDINEISNNEKLKISEQFKIRGFDVNGYTISKCPTFRYWDKNPEIWEDIAKGKDSKTFKEITEGIMEIIEIEKSIIF